MATPDGRSWLTSEALADRFLDYLIAYDSRVEQFISNRPEVVGVVKDAFADLYSIEFKIARLCEKLRDSIDAGTITTFEEVRSAIKDIYTLSVLEQFDEDGNLLP